ncbi:hypothetical protein [Acinetobacter pseudolwoffii]|jgi:hypothetical protein|uniref:hypothetical protein n=1 Tax=Acinetobacter pseudolwoffii TaxID=2053287 RepID=UPI000C2491EB|nr:hypothetical protein [Acinetobacter pseudolwoffii]PJI30668.1 hypothetical protein CU478_03940 [Acinetobacter pseudolwoffii]
MKNTLLKLGILTILASTPFTVWGQKIPADALQLSTSSLETRQMQTRQFDGLSETDALAAAAGVLQDMGFTLTESEAKLGVIVGNKDRSAVSGGQVAGALLLTLLSGVPVDYDNNQKIIASLVTRPALDSQGRVKPNSFYVRVTFARMVWNTANQLTKAEPLNDSQLYQEFFDKLSKSVFLEGQKI